MTALRLALAQTNLFSPQHLAASRLPASHPDQGSQAPRGTFLAAEHCIGRVGAASSAWSDPPVSARGDRELPCSHLWGTVDSQVQHTHLRVPPHPQSGRSKASRCQSSWNEKLLSSLLGFVRVVRVYACFSSILYEINSTAGQWRYYYAPRIHEPRVSLELSHEHLRVFLTLAI